MELKVCTRTGDVPEGQPVKPPEGLTTECQVCKPVLELVQVMNDKLRGFTLRATIVDPEEDECLDRADQKVCGPYRVHCEACQGTRLQLTAEGRRLVGLVKLFLDRAELGWTKASEDQIPF